jgi:hypothetical protein
MQMSRIDSKVSAATWSIPARLKNQTTPAKSRHMPNRPRSPLRGRVSVESSLGTVGEGNDLTRIRHRPEVGIPLILREDRGPESGSPRRRPGLGCRP